MKKRVLSASPKLFTQDAANATLPLVSAIFSDLATLWGSVGSARRRVERLVENRVSCEATPYSDELMAMQEKLAKDAFRVESLIDELREIGIEFKASGGECHACFPAMLDGRLVYLSWKAGEPEVAHWVELDGDVSERCSLLNPVA